MTDWPHGDTPPTSADFAELDQLSSKVRVLEKFDKEVARGIIGDHLLLPAVEALRDGLCYRSKRGLPAKGFVREFMQIVKLSGDPPQLAAQIVNMLGMPVEQAMPILAQGAQIQSLDAHELARRAMKSLMVYRGAFAEEFKDLCESFGIDVEPLRRTDASRVAKKKASPKRRALPLHGEKL